LQWWWKKRHGPARRPKAQAIGAPMVSAGMIGSMQPITRLFSVSMFGGTYVTDAQGRILAIVPFYEEGLAIADVVLGSTGGEPGAKVFKDPGLGSDLIDCLVRDLPNMRPRHTGRSGVQVADGRSDVVRQKVRS